MTNGQNPPVTDGRRKRLALVAAAVLAVTGATAVSVGAFRSPAAPPLAAAAPEATGTRSATTPGELTKGPLMPTSAPTRVSIPALKVSVPVIGLGQQADGSMQVPADARTVGWYTKAPTPGALGPAVLAGHVDFKKQPGSFAHLADLKAGDRVTIDREDGSRAMFSVARVKRYPKAAFPSASVYGAIDHAGLRLITCGGDFDSSAGHYKDNVVVYATLTMAHPVQP